MIKFFPSNRSDGWPLPFLLSLSFFYASMLLPFCLPVLLYLSSPPLLCQIFSSLSHKTPCSEFCRNCCRYAFLPSILTGFSPIINQIFQLLNFHLKLISALFYFSNTSHPLLYHWVVPSAPSGSPENLWSLPYPLLYHWLNLLQSACSLWWSSGSPEYLWSLPYPLLYHWL